MLRHAWIVALVLTFTAAADGKGPWDLEALRKPPKVTWDSKGTVSTLSYAGEPFKGKPTRIFAYLAKPEKLDGKAPAMVLVHGGGGTAFREWVELWAKRGYVALAMDLAGAEPVEKRDSAGRPTKGTKKMPDGGPGQGDGDKFFFDGKVVDFWSYHAVAAVIRGVSLLASLPEVDADRIGITGISWGGYLTCIVAGLDDRLKVAIPVYGCGFIHANSVWNGILARMKEDRRKLWVENFEPSRYLAGAKMPVLFVNGTNDFAYPLDSYQKSYRLVQDRTLAVTVRLPHGHPQGWAPMEIGLFVDQHLRKGKPLAKITAAKREGKTVTVLFKSEVPMKSAALCWTTDTGAWQKRVWQSLPLKVSGDRVEAELPKGRPLVYFVTITDDRKATVSTEHEEVGQKASSSTRLPGAAPLSLPCSTRRPSAVPSSRRSSPTALRPCPAATGTGCTSSGWASSDSRAPGRSRSFRRPCRAAPPATADSRGCPSSCSTDTGSSSCRAASALLPAPCPACWRCRRPAA
jgi:dienelactone hydrolase